MQSFTDTYGHKVTGNADGTWTRDGLTVGPCTQEQASGVFAGMAPAGWTPPAPPPVTTITPAQLLARLTPAEALGIQTAALSNAQVALWLTNLSLNTSVTSTDAAFTQGVAAFVAAGLLTSDRAAVIGNFSAPSP